MNFYRKTIICSSLGLLAAQLTTQPLLSVYAESTDPNLEKKLDIAATYLKDGSQATFSSNVSSASPGYLSHLTNENISMTRVDSTQQLFYSVPKADVSDGSYIDLDISYSDLLLPTSSTITVAIDGRPLKSISLTKDTSSRLIKRIFLGSEDVTPGFHNVTIVKHSTVSDDLCSDEENPANWVKINRSTAIFLNTTTTFTTNDALKNYPFPFVEQSVQDEMYGAVLLPDHPSADLISSAMQVATYFSSNTATKRSTPIMTESEWLSKGRLIPAIALGSISDWGGPIKQMLQANQIQVQGQQLSMDTFAVKDQIKNEVKQVLLVSAADDKIIKEHIHLLTEKNFVDQLAGNHLVIDTSTRAAETVTPIKPITFESLGTSNIKLDDSNLNSDRLTYTIPSYWSLTGESQLTLKVRVSSLLQNDIIVSKDNKSTASVASNGTAGLTVIINDIPKTFSFAEIVKAKKEDDSFLLPIPLAPYVKETKTNTLTMAFSAHLNETHTNACGPKSNNGKWIFIDKNSTIQIPHEVQKETSFKNWPAPFVGDQGLDHTVFLLPKDVDGAFLSQLATLTREMTSQSSNHGAIDIVRDQDPELAKKLKDRNVIVIGNPNTFVSLQSYMDQLLVNSGNGQFQHLPNSNIINETTDYAAWIQTSMWDKERVMAVFQPGENNKKAKDSFVHTNLLQFLNNEQKSSQVVVMSKSNEVLSFDIKAEQKTNPEAPPATKPVSKTTLIWVVAVIGVIFFIGLFFFIRLLRRPK
ncbi:cellulose biosynthesis cyclic di-GMP-binding regulatory protein BcsB [Paenibacillus sp. SYP-B3998]|uniref:Cellulose biosynthesis cyclic di-GMP-binding regulatory protein BcsB n=1 Tax=Paenibacillus sp. SYP-B3998 TaxID=2678564 RepID=A0A6G3ZSD5_9BACL|nr:cellulose biosynthesis cyclic di-GMP-binding regulatory protein BcsB [Paenibacillus sp. SYP-B3998]NEW04970.1 cellulose biosynthesis cyclic di-GMP-binding regulatory protein BcsB [Paenibacillus sp. SYP-B3998]